MDALFDRLVACADFSNNEIQEYYACDDDRHQPHEPKQDTLVLVEIVDGVEVEISQRHSDRVEELHDEEGQVLVLYAGLRLPLCLCLMRPSLIFLERLCESDDVQQQSADPDQDQIKAKEGPQVHYHLLHHQYQVRKVFEYPQEEECLCHHYETQDNKYELFDLL